MNKIPILGFAAYSGTGKTTLIEQLILKLRERGVRVAVIKHDAHDFEIDCPGKDTWRYTQAGAAVSAICSGTHAAIMEQRSLTFRELLSRIRDVDIILVEGFKSEPITQIGMSRKATGKGFPARLDRYVAVITDEDDIPGKQIKFSFDKLDAAADFIMLNKDKFTTTDSLNSME